MICDERRVLPIFTVAVSLGGDCVPAYHIQIAHKLPTISSPFDHIITPTTSLLTLIQYDFIDFLDPTMLHEMLDHNGIRYVLDRRYGCLFLHDFELGERLDSARVREKFNYKIDQFRSMLRSDEVVLFVKHHCGRGDAERFAILMGRLFPKLKWHLLVVNDYVDDDWNLASISNRYMDASIAYPGDGVAWSTALTEFTIVPRGLLRIANQL